MNSKKLLVNTFAALVLQILLLCVSFKTYAQVNTWQSKQAFGGTGRSGAVAFSIGAKGYIGTGYDSNPTKDFWEYDPSTDTWAQKADFGGGERNHAAGFSIGSKGYLGTGLRYCMCENTKDFWEYDPATNVWTRKADFAGPSRHVAIGLSIGNKGYIGTGTATNYAPLYNDFWEYDPTADTWTQKADFAGGARYYTSAFSVGKKGYIGTGTDFTGGGFTYRKDFWEYDQNTDTWLRKADFAGTAREGAVGFNINNKGYIGTGYDGSSTYSAKDFWEYDNLLDSWTRKADFGGGERFSSAGFSIGSTGYIGVGVAGARVNDFWAYTSAVPTIACSNNNSVLYYGYSGDQTVTVTGTPNGGTGPYSVSITMDRPLKCNVITSSGNEIWTSGPGTSTNSNTICPTIGISPISVANNIAQGGSYSVTATLMADAVFTITVTDALGYSATCTTNVHAEDARCFAGNSSNQKVTLCHKTGNNNNPCVTICIAQSAVQEHLDHGDFLGNCTTNCVAPPTSLTTRGSQGQIVIETSKVDGFDVKILPNPSSTSDFRLQVFTVSSEEITTRVMDILGRKVKILKAQPYQSIQFGNELKPGIYFIEVRQGVNRKVIKLVKQ